MPQERRTLLRWLLGGGFTASVLSFLYPAVKFMNPPTVPEASTNEVSAGKVQSLKPNSGKIVKFGSRPALLIRVNETEWRAYLCNLHPSQLHGPIPGLHAANLVRLPQRVLRPHREGRLRTPSPALGRVCSSYPGRGCCDHTTSLKSVKPLWRCRQREGESVTGLRSGWLSMRSVSS